MRDWHKQRGWNDIGYHFVISNGYPSYSFWKETKPQDGWLGKVEEGRHVSERGAHCPAANADSLAICCIGNYMHSEPPATVWRSLGDLCIRLCREYDISSDEIWYHEDLSATDCPGQLFFERNSLRALVALERAPKNQPLPEGKEVKVVLNDGLIGMGFGSKATFADHIDDQGKVYIYIQ